jgi:Domain of unknown function (DUF222)/HNH endonuclease
MLATQDVYAIDAIDAVGLTAEDRRERLIRKRHVIDLMELSFSQEAAEFAATNEYEHEGSVTPIDWIRINCHMTGPAAADRVAVGQLVTKLEQTVDALAYGQVGFAHLTVMARTADAVGPRFNETALLKKARENSPGKFHHICRHYRHAVDACGFAAEQVEQVEKRRLSLSTWFDGSLLLSGVLDSVGGAALRTALEPLARKSGAHDDRNRERRFADALVELASGGEQRAQIQVTSSLEILLGLAGAPAAEMEFSLPVSSKTIERLACDCSITRVLLNSESTVIDVGCSKRVVSEPGRRALRARDGSCRWPGCERPASWSAAHHLVHWIHGGTTDLDNLILLCHRHHWMVHEGKWQLVRSDDGRMLTIPPTVTFGPSPRGPD